MITEADALQYAQLDAKALFKRLEAGAMPDDIARTVIRRILFRIQEMENPRALELAKESAAQRLTAPTFSEHLAARCVKVVLAAMRSLPPEDSRALGLWFTGTPPGVPGFLQHSIHGLAESSGPAASENAAAQIGAIITRMQQLDQDLFEKQIKALTGPRRRIIRGLLLDAQWAFTEGDGITARMRVISARKTAKRWLRDHTHHQELLGGQRSS